MNSAGHQNSSKLPIQDSERKKHLQYFEKRIAIRFRRLELLNLAFCHRSYANETPDCSVNNEKLEFLGDSVLGLVTAGYLYTNFPNKTEGELARIKSFVVSEHSLADIAAKLGIDEMLLIGKGEEMSGGRLKRAILADALESVIGALFIDQNFKAAKRFVLSLMIPEIEKVIQNRHRKDYKTLLQEFLQKTHKSYPQYSLVRKTGPDHAKTFWVQVRVLDQVFGPGQALTKKEAEQAAARLAWDALQGDATE